MAEDVAATVVCSTAHRLEALPHGAGLGAGTGVAGDVAATVVCSIAAGSSRRARGDLASSRRPEVPRPRRWAGAGSSAAGAAGSSVGATGSSVAVAGKSTGGASPADGADDVGAPSGTLPAAAASGLCGCS